MKRVAFQGVAGAFSHEACLTFAPDHEPVAFDGFEAAYASVVQGACQIACLPIRNVVAGEVEPVARLISAGPLRTVSEHDLLVRQNLLANPEVTLDQVAVIASHPMALNQCRRFLDALGRRTETAFDTAGAARDLSLAPDPQRAVIAALTAARLYGLSVLAADIQDDPSNRTAFLILSP